MRPTYVQRSTFGVSLLPGMQPARLPTIALLTACACCWLLRSPLAEAQTQQRSAIVRPSQTQVVTQTGAEALGQRDSSQLRSPLPTEAWTGSNATLPPIPGGPNRQDPTVVRASYNAQPQSGTNTPAPGNPNTSATNTKERVPLAQRAESSELEKSTTGSGSTLQMLLSVGSSLLIVIGLFLGIAWFYRKTINSSTGGLPKQVVSILGRTPIAPRQQLLLVRFGSKLVLVSLVQGEARTISEITDPLEVDQLAGLCESSQPGSISASFRSILNQGGSAA